ncbi:hypothetical protein D3C77_602660 [compost metagenome]
MSGLRLLIRSDHAGNNRQPAARPSHNKEELKAAVLGSAPSTDNSFGAQTTPPASKLPNSAEQISALIHTWGIFTTSASALKIDTMKLAKPCSLRCSG